MNKSNLQYLYIEDQELRSILGVLNLRRINEYAASSLVNSLDEISSSLIIRPSTLYFLHKYINENKYQRDITSLIKYLAFAMIVLLLFFCLILLILGNIDGGEGLIVLFILLFTSFYLYMELPKSRNRTKKKLSMIKPNYLGIVLDEVDQYNKVVESLIITDQLEKAGNKGILRDKDKVIKAVQEVKAELIRALKTEKILRDNPGYSPDKIVMDFSALRALDVSNLGEYTKVINDSWEIALRVQDEMNKLRS